MSSNTLTADNGVISGTSGIKYNGGNDGTLQLQTTTAGGTATTALTIDTSQNVGIGTASPTKKLELGSLGALRLQTGSVTMDCTPTAGAVDGFVWNVSAGYYSWNLGGAQKMILDANGNVGIGTGSPSSKLHVAGGAGSTIRNTASSGSSWFVGTNVDSYILHNESNTPMLFTTNGTERMRINAGAPILCLAGGNASATGTGIAFPATQSASSDANTLDDYEEGTWTPNIGGTATYIIQVGVYTKVGRMVTVQCDLYINLRGTGSTTRIYGLPFAASPGNYYTANVAYFASLPSPIFWIQGIVPVTGTPEVYFETITSTSGQTAANDASAIFQNSTRLIFTATYFTA